MSRTRDRAPCERWAPASACLDWMAHGAPQLPSKRARPRAPQERRAGTGARYGASATWLRGRAAHAGMRGLERIERALRGLPFRAVGREREDLLPGFGRALDILL